MNFSNMPELEYENSYFIFLGALAALALSMVYFFYVNGWFD
jgi:Mg2+ and Co2+ transporter CorA